MGITAYGLDLSIRNCGLVTDDKRVLLDCGTRLSLASSVPDMVDFAEKIAERIWKDAPAYANDNVLVIDWTVLRMRGRKGQEKKTGLLQGVVLGLCEQYCQDIILVEPAQVRKSLSLKSTAKKEEVWKKIPEVESLKCSEHGKDAYVLAYLYKIGML